MTEYIVLHWDSDAASWSELSPHRSASSADAAIRAEAEERGLDGQYVAVPARSWNPRSVNVVQAVKVSFGSAT